MRNMRRPTLADDPLIPEAVEPNISETKDSHMEPSGLYPDMTTPEGGKDVPYTPLQGTLYR